MEVAVVRSVGENHTADMAGGAAMTVTPQMPLRMEQMWLVTRKYVLFRLTERKTVPIAIRKATSIVVSRRPLQHENYNYTGFRIYGPRFCPDEVDHIAEMTIYPKNLVIKYD